MKMVTKAWHCWPTWPPHSCWASDSPARAVRSRFPLRPHGGRPVTETLGDGRGTTAGALDVQKLVVQNGALRAVGTLHGAVTNAAGTVHSAGLVQTNG